MSKAPVKLQGFGNRLRAWFVSLILEHNFTNIFRLNLHRVTPELYRSSQPTPWQLRRIVRKLGIKTVINLRGAKPHRPVYALEKETLDSLGVRMIDVEIFSRAVPSRRRLEALKNAFAEAEPPILMHCKAGADRTGLAATLYLFWKEGRSPEEADQLKFFPYGHIKNSDAGIIDFYFEEFLRHRSEHPDADLLEWTETLDPVEMKERFRRQKERPLADWINNVLLRRE